MSWSGIEVRLRIARPGFELDVAFESTGRAVGLFGPSGAGKTTILEASAGWRDPMDGFVRVGEATLLDTARGRSVPVESRGVGYLSQDDLLFPHWTVWENIRAGSRRAALRGGDAATFERAVGRSAQRPLFSGSDLLRTTDRNVSLSPHSRSDRAQTVEQVCERAPYPRRRPQYPARCL